jgi:ubiquitin-conjugating enzyme E2 M
MKKNEDAAAKKKPKTSAAQIRVQKGRLVCFTRRSTLPYAEPWNIDLTELDLPPTMKTNFPDPADLLNFSLTITPDEGMLTCLQIHQFIRVPTYGFVTGMYKGGSFTFSFVINTNYPHDPPKVKCTQKVCRVVDYIRIDLLTFTWQIYHPNVDLEGNVCLNILREDWKPVLNLNSVMVGLQYLFLEPNADDPLNKGIDDLFPLVEFIHSGLISTEAAIEMSKNREQFLSNVKYSMKGVVIKGVHYDNVSAQ